MCVFFYADILIWGQSIKLEKQMNVERCLNNSPLFVLLEFSQNYLKFAVDEKHLACSLFTVTVGFMPAMHAQ